MRKFNIEIVTPEGCAYSGECESVTLRTDLGDVQIMAGHADYLAALDTGSLTLQLEGGTRYASSSGGFVSVSGGRVRVVVTTLEFADDIDEGRAERAKAVAEARLRDAKTDAEIAGATAKLKRAISRIKVAKLR